MLHVALMNSLYCDTIFHCINILQFVYIFSWSTYLDSFQFWVALFICAITNNATTSIPEHNNLLVHMCKSFLSRVHIWEWNWGVIKYTCIQKDQIIKNSFFQTSYINLYCFWLFHALTNILTCFEGCGEGWEVHCISLLRLP